MTAGMLHCARAALLGGCVWVVAACGGGGGGSGGGGSTPAGVDLTLSNVAVPTVEQEVFEGIDPLQPLVITADVTGNLANLNGKAVYVVVEDADQLVGDVQVALGAGGRNNQVVINGRARNERTGDFRGSFGVNICLDPACSQPFQGSPIRVPYHVKVLPGLGLARSEPIALTATFPAGAAPWTSAVRLPQGANGFSAILGPGLLTGLGLNAFDLVSGPDTVTLTGKPAPVGRVDASLQLQANGTTSKGRVVTLFTSVPIDYTVAAPAQFQIVYASAQVELTVTSTTINPRVPGFVDTLASDGKAYIVADRIDYLPGDGVTTRNANGIAWLRRESEAVGDRAGRSYYSGWFVVSASACTFDPGFACLAPGQYDALVYPRTLAGEQSPVPVRVRLTVTP